jgi:hypothetical protein
MISKNNIFGKNAVVLARKSFMAYVKPMGIWFVFWIIISTFSTLFGLLFIVVGVVIILNIQSFVLFVDDNGIWMYSGITEWNSGTYGIKWCNFGEAIYYRNPISYSLQSYTIYIIDKYRQENKVVLKHIHNGDKVVSEINEIFMNF